MKLEELIIKPHTLSFLTTYQCTATCRNCCFKCNPSIKVRLSLKQMKDYVDECMTYYGDTLKVLVLTGGECFLLENDLNSIIEYATSKGLSVRVVTNGYWAKSLDVAKAKLLELAKCGLKEVNFSTGDDHQEWVCYDNIVYGSIAAIDLGLTCVINVESHDKSKFKSKVFYEDERLKKYLDVNNENHLIITNGVWIPFEKINNISYNNLVINNSEYKGCKSLFCSISINPYSNVLACCGLTSEYLPCMRLGNAQTHSIKDLYEEQFKDFMKIWLFVEGPQKILKYIYEKSGIKNTFIGHNCAVCAEIFKDSKNIQCLYDNCNEIATSIMLKYNIILKKSTKVNH